MSQRVPTGIVKVVTSLKNILFIYYLFIYLAALDLSCGMLDLVP